MLCNEVSGSVRDKSWEFTTGAGLLGFGINVQFLKVEHNKSVYVRAS